MTNTNTYPFGSQITLTVRVQNNVTPDTMVISVRDPDRELSQPAVTLVSAGVFTAQVVGNKAGAWTWRADSTNPIAGGERKFAVESTKFRAGG